MHLYQSDLETPVGPVLLLTDGRWVRAVEFEGGEERLHRLLALRYGHVRIHAVRQSPLAALCLQAYFDGDLHALEGVPVATCGTPFQESVWRALRDIPPGGTSTYQEIARRIGRPRANRAVGLANGANLISLFLPCHRVVGADQSLTGYAGGLTRKEWLLRHEGVELPVRGTSNL